MVRRLLPLLAPLACGLGAWLAPAYADALLHAAYGSLLTLLLALPVLIWGLPVPEPASLAAVPAAPASSSRFSWGRLGWSGLALSSLGAVVWMTVSFVAMAVNPADAFAWSMHVLGSLFALLLLAPLAVFLRPAPVEATAVPAAVDAPAEPTASAKTATDFVPPSFFDAAPSTSPADSVPAEAAQGDGSYSAADLRSIWSYAGDGAGGDGLADHNGFGDGISSRTDTTDSYDVPDTPTPRGWPWTDAATEAPAPVETTAPATASTSNRTSPDTIDTNWELSVWPFDDDSGDNWFREDSNDPACVADEDEDDDTWPPSNWPTFEYY